MAQNENQLRDLEQQINDISKKILLLAELHKVKFTGSGFGAGVRMEPVCKECGK